MTGEELGNRNIAAMGEVPGKQYSLLNNEVAILHLYWKEYVELFGTNQKRVDRLNRTAPGFFRMLQTELFQTDILHLARLTDPLKTESTGARADFGGSQQRVFRSGRAGVTGPEFLWTRVNASSSRVDARC